VLTLFLIPFIDRGPMVRLGKRTFAFSFVVLAVLAWTGLTTAAVVTTPKNQESVEDADASVPGPNPQSPTPLVEAAWQRLSPHELAGLGLFKKQGCMSCHPGAGQTGVGPDLTRMPAAQRTVAWMVPHFKNPSKIVPGSVMPPVELSDVELNALALFVLKLTPQNEKALESAPDFATQGALVYEKNHCDSCHQIQGVGTALGPALDGVGLRHDQAWLEKHFADPPGVTKGSIMPPYKFAAADLDAICKYLLQLPKGA